MFWTSHPEGMELKWLILGAVLVLAVLAPQLLAPGAVMRVLPELVAPLPGAPLKP